MSDDELKNKSGKVKVMYVRSDDDSDRRTHNPRTGKGGGRPGKSRVDGRNRPARDEKESRGGDRKRDDRKREGFGGEGSSPWRTVSRAPGDEAPEKALSILKCCAASARKKPAFMVKTPARRSSRAVRTPSFAPGLSRA